MTFEEWFEDYEKLGYSWDDDPAENAWDYQQSKIDQLEKDKQELIDCCKSIKEGQQPYENESGYIKISLHKYAIPSIAELLK